MRSLIRPVVQLTGIALMAALAACGGSGGGSSLANLRVINATAGDALNVTIDGSLEFEDLQAASTSTYASISSGARSVTLTSVSGSLTSSTQSLPLSGGVDYALVAYDRQGAIRTALFPENQLEPLTGYGTLNVGSVSADPGPLDVYVVAPGTTSLAGLSPTFQSVSVVTTTATTLPAGTYDIFATAAGNRTDLRFSLASVAVASTQIQTLIFTSTVGGGLVNGVLMTQGGAVEFAFATDARVRVVSALPPADASAVVATVGDEMLSAVYAPSAGAYTAVPGDVSAYSITVAGTAVAGLPAATFSAGGDYTILVYETTDAPLVTVFTDDNRLPNASQANVRLVNAGLSVPGGLTLYNNGSAVANSVTYGTASEYVGTPPSGLANLELVAAGISPVSKTVTLLSNSVYTVFVLDSSLTPYVIRDR